MARLLVQTDDLAISFTADRYASAAERAAANIGMDALQALYGAKDARFFLREDEEDESKEDDHASFELHPGEVGRARAFFFDNVVYGVYVAFRNAACRRPRVLHRQAAFEGLFTSTPDRRALQGSINFGNDIGRTDFTVGYEKDGAPRTFTFTTEVLSQKLDYHRDWKKILDDVERRYPMLAADFLKRTYHAFDRVPNQEAETPDLIWWNLFEAEQEDFVKAVRTVLARPRRRISGTEEWRRADQITKLTPLLENALAEHRSEQARLYRVSSDATTHDTVENRFVKYALEVVGKRYSSVCEKIRKENTVRDASGKETSRLSKEALDQMAGTEKTLRQLHQHPFFRGVGRFTGLRQVSLTLQNGPGYAAVMRIFAILRASYLLYDGMKRLETKNIADLYEIWCFLKIEEIVRDLRPNAVVDARHGELGGLFVKQLATGYRSEVVYRTQDGVELARVIYNPAVTQNEQRKGGLAGTVTPTSLKSGNSQTPDIVLQLSCRSPEGEGAFHLTYLFDAKYRIDGRYPDGVDYPPQDAIDQMHRYRDSIYFNETPREELSSFAYKKEVVGGYILFPGAGKVELERPKDPDEPDVRPQFVKSIDAVNIGAIPLRPNDAGSGLLLKRFIAGLMSEEPSVEAVYSRVNPQKGALVPVATPQAVAEATLYGTYHGKAQRDWIFEKGLYNLPVESAEGVGIRSPEDARKKRLLALVPPGRRTSEKLSVVRIHEFVGIVDRPHLERIHGYPPIRKGQVSRGPYYLWRVGHAPVSSSQVEDLRICWDEVNPPQKITTSTAVLIFITQMPKRGVSLLAERECADKLKPHRVVNLSDAKSFDDALEFLRQLFEEDGAHVVTLDIVPPPEYGKDEAVQRQVRDFVDRLLQYY